MVRITAMVHHDDTQSKKAGKFKNRTWKPTISNIESEELESVEKMVLPLSQNYVKVPLTSSNLSSGKVKHMSKSKVGFVSINGTQSCELPEKELGNYLEPKQVSR